jgi:ADP-ribose pyrophosphatase
LSNSASRHVNCRIVGRTFAHTNFCNGVEHIWGQSSFSGKTLHEEIPNLKYLSTNDNPMPHLPLGNQVAEKHGPWTIVKANEVYSDPWMAVRMDNVLRPDGSPGTYSTVRIKPGVCVIPVSSDGTCYLTKEFHYAVGRDTIEGISGGIEVDETAELAAARELQEEVGLIADKWISLGTVDPLTAALSSPTRLFLALELRFTDASPEGTECIERVEMPFEKALAMVIASEISHAPTCVAILKANLILQSMLNS